MVGLVLLVGLPNAPILFVVMGGCILTVLMLDGEQASCTSAVAVVSVVVAAAAVATERRCVLVAAFVIVGGCGRGGEG